MDFDICNKCLNEIDLIHFHQVNDELVVRIYNKKESKGCMIITKAINKKDFYKVFYIYKDKIGVSKKDKPICFYEITYEQFIRLYFNKIKCNKQCQFLAEQTMKEIYKEKK